MKVYCRGRSIDRMLAVPGPSVARPLRALIILALILLPAILAARGQAQIDLSVAEKLIAQKRYSEARAYIHDYQRTYPLYFEEADKLMLRILRAENEYVAAYNALVAAIEKDPSDIKSQTEFMRRMKAIDPERFEERKDLDVIYAARTIKVYRDAADSVWTRGRDALAKGQGAQAVAIFREGFTVYREEFNAPDSGFEPSLVSSVNAKIQAVEALSAAWSAALPAFEAAMSAILGALDRRPADFQAVLDREREGIRRLILLRNDAATAGRELLATYAALAREGDSREERSFIPYAWRFILGRPPAEVALGGLSPSSPEGIVGAMDATWISAAARVEAKAKAKIETLLAQAEKAHDAATPTLVLAQAQDIRAWNREVLRFSSLWTLVLASDAAADPATMRRWIGQDWIPGRAAAALDIIHAERVSFLLADSSAALLRLRNIRSQAQTEVASAAALSLATELLAIDDAVEGLEKERQGIIALETAAADLRAEYLAYANADKPGALPLLPWEGRQAGLLDRLSAAQKEDEAAQLALVLGRAGAESSQALRSAALNPAVLDEAEADLSGYPSDRSDWTNPLFYPDRAARLTVEALSKARAGRAELAAIPGRYARYQAFISGSSALAAWRASVEASVAELDAYSARAAAIQARALERKATADSYRAQAEKSMRDARTALAREDFDGSKTFLDRARDQRGLSLTQQWDETWWLSFNAEIATLDGQVDRRRREVVARDRRILLTRGQEAYLQSEFTEARDSFTRAQTLWRSVFTTDDPEIEQWITLVRNATAFQTETEIRETHPDYGRVSQLLYTASSSYDRARKLDAAGQKGAAKELLEEKALPAIKAIKIDYPRHKEAEILRLRVAILIDRTKGMEEFKAQFDAAVKKIESRNRPRVQEGLAELQVLQGIDPRYPGMTRALQNAQAFLRPAALEETITAADRAAAADYTRQAQAIWDRNDRSQFPRALELVNLSLQRWPANAAATALKERLIVEIPGREEVAMTGELDSLYNEAFTALQNNQIVRAQQILERMLGLNPELRGGNRRFQQLYNRAFQ